MQFVTKDQALIARILGDLDHHTATEMIERMDYQITVENAKVLVIDLSGLSFMDSSGIGVLIGRYKIMGSLGGRVLVVSGNPMVDKILDLSGVRKILSVYDSVDAAMDGLRQIGKEDRHDNPQSGEN